MAYIKVIEADEAEGALKERYEALMASRNGRLPKVLQIMGLSPDTMAAVENLNNTISFGGSTLGRRREEMIATLVSKLNHCEY